MSGCSSRHGAVSSHHAFGVNADEHCLRQACQSSRSAAPSTRGQPNNLWTEPPSERAQRVADEVASRKRRAMDVEGAKEEDEEARRKRRRDDELKRVVEQHSVSIPVSIFPTLADSDIQSQKSSRSHTLLDMHHDSSSSKDNNKDDKDGPPGIWDHSRDMAMGGRLMDDKQRGKLIADARGLGDRFGSGKGGGYLESAGAAKVRLRRRSVCVLNNTTSSAQI